MFAGPAPVSRRQERLIRRRPLRWGVKMCSIMRMSQRTATFARPAGALAALALLCCAALLAALARARLGRPPDRRPRPEEGRQVRRLRRADPEEGQAGPAQALALPLPLRADQEGPQPRQVPPDDHPGQGAGEDLVPHPVRAAAQEGQDAAARLPHAPRLGSRAEPRPARQGQAPATRLAARPVLLAAVDRDARHPGDGERPRQEPADVRLLGLQARGAADGPAAGLRPGQARSTTPTTR